jgi:prepilin-type N-terminal cleavage/methylation domain-containing protein
MKRRQAGLTLIELMVAMALTALLGVMLAALVNGWLKVRERLQVTRQENSVLEFCLALSGASTARYCAGCMSSACHWPAAGSTGSPIASSCCGWQPRLCQRPRVAHGCSANAYVSTPANSA